MLAQALIASALAASSCELDPSTFRAAIVDARSALGRDDLASAQHEVDRVFEGISCITFAPEPRLWAELMVVVSVIAFAEGEDWQSPLEAALRLRPAIDRIVGVVHPMYDWTPPEAQALQPIVSRNQLYIDGRAVQARPPPRGWYLLQKTDGTAWNTRWRRDEPMDLGWLTDPVERPPRLAIEVTLGATAALGAAGQWGEGFGEQRYRSVYDLGWVEARGEDLVGEGSDWDALSLRFGRPFRERPILGVDGGLRLTVFTRFGVSLYGTGLAGLRPITRYLRGMATWVGRRVDLSLGMAVYDLHLARYRQAFVHDDGLVYDPGADPESNSLVAGGEPFYFGMAEVMFTPADPVRIAARIGLRDLSSQMGEVEFRYRARPLARLPEVLQARPFVTAFVRGGYGRFRQNGLRADEVPVDVVATRLESGLTAGLTFGGVP